MMDLIKNLRHMCRICAVNMKKRRSQNSAVSIFDTPQLRDKLKKYLNIDIPNNDDLPKSICSICYKKVESIHALAALAKKTENFLLDFIKIAQVNLKEAQSTSYQAHFPNEFSSINLLSSNDDDDLNYSSNSNTMVLPVESDITPDLSVTAKTKEQDKKAEEVVLNFTLNDPLTKNIQKKIVVAKQKQSLQNSLKNNNKNFSSASHIKLNEEVEISPIKPITDAGEFIREVHNSLQQKRQNLKMVLNNNSTQSPSSILQRNTTTDPNSNYKVILPSVPSTSSSMNSQNINVAVQMQQQPNIFSQQQTDPPPAHIQPVETVQLSKDVIAHAHLSSNGNSSAFVKESMNLGSVIKDMDLLKLILKALKWPYNQETLWMQIQRLKNTRFRDVMIDPNLLQDADLMQILSSYLSPILLQQHQAQNSVSVSNIPPPPTLSPSAINILPPSVSYKIPAETSVRLVSVPREEQSKPCVVEPREVVTLELQQSRDEKREFKKKLKHHRRLQQSVIHQNEHYNSAKNREPPVIVLSDDEETSSLQEDLTVTKKDTTNVIDYAPKVDLSMMQNFDSSTEVIKAINKSLSLYHQSRALNAEVTIQQRKKQKRKQSLNRIEFQKNFNDQEIVIIDEHGEQPFKLSNEVSVVPKSSSSTVSASTLIKKSDSIQKPAKLKFDFLLPPKKKRKLQMFDTKSTEKYQSTSSSKTSNNSNDFPTLVETIKEKSDFTSNNTISTQKICDESAERGELTTESISNESQVTKTKNSTTSIENNNQANISTSEIKPQILSVQVIEPINENSTMSSDKKESSKSDESVKNVNIEQQEPNEDPDDESDDGLVIDENYEEKVKDEEPKTENIKGSDNISKESANKESIEEQETILNEESETKLGHKNEQEKQSVIKKTIKEENESDQEEQSNDLEIFKSSKNIKNEDDEDQEKSTDKDKKYKTNTNVRNSKSNLDKLTSNDKEIPRRTTRNKREMPLITATNKKSKESNKDAKESKTNVSPKTPSVGRRIKTRHQEEVKKMQTRNSNISQRGREQKPSTKYNNKSTLRKRI